MRMNRILLTAAALCAVAVALAPASAFAKPPCNPGKPTAPVGYYTNTWCYPGLNTYQNASHSGWKQVVVPRGHMLNRTRGSRLGIVAPR